MHLSITLGHTRTRARGSFGLGVGRVGWCALRWPCHFGLRVGARAEAAAHRQTTCHAWLRSWWGADATTLLDTEEVAKASSKDAADDRREEGREPRNVGEGTDVAADGALDGHAEGGGAVELDTREEGQFEK
jgi:hypothetical protein